MKANEGLEDGEVAVGTIRIPEVQVTCRTFGDDPRITAYLVVVRTPTGMWRERFGSREQLDAFLAGLKAAWGILGVHVADPEIREQEKCWRCHVHYATEVVYLKDGRVPYPFCDVCAPIAKEDPQQFPWDEEVLRWEPLEV